MNKLESNPSSEIDIKETERLISVEIEKNLIARYFNKLKEENPETTSNQAGFEWIKQHALDFRTIFDRDKKIILDKYHGENGLEESSDYIEKALPSKEKIGV